MTAPVWREFFLGDVVEFLDYKRKPLNSTERASRQGPYPYYGASGPIDSVDGYLFDGRFLLVAEDGENLNSRKLPLAFFATGKFWVNNHAHVIRGIEGIVDDDFLKHWFACNSISGYITGAAQPKLSQASMKRISLRLPDYSQQRRIASILSAYDDLIENNTRRIAILEEMARRIYEEWFVRFRFPGHENVRMVQSELGPVPEGWQERPVLDVAIVHRGRSYKGSELAEEGGRPFVNLKCIERDGGYRSSGLKRYTGAFKESHTVRAGEMVMAVTDMTQERRIVARVGRVGRLDADFGVVSMDLVRIASRGDFQEAYLYAMFRWSGFADQVKQHANGANVLHLLPARIEEHVFVCPPAEVANRFAAVLSPMLSLCDTLEQKNANLRTTRDLLLPKLISGELDVSAMPDPEAAAA